MLTLRTRAYPCGRPSELSHLLCGRSRLTQSSLREARRRREHPRPRAPRMVDAWAPGGQWTSPNLLEFASPMLMPGITGFIEVSLLGLLLRSSRHSKRQWIFAIGLAVTFRGF